MNVAVIGSGPAGTACAKALVRCGLTPTVIDVAERLPKERQAAVDRMAAVTPAAWDAADRALVTENWTLAGTGVPKKMVFGSDYAFGGDRPFSPTEADDELPSATFARGGYTVAWGAAVLPADDSDIQDWPIGSRDLEQSYRRVLAELPLSAQDDSLCSSFPIYKDDIRSLPASPEIEAFLSDTRQVVEDKGTESFLCGRARLAVEAQQCRLCGLCLSGCVYGAIYSTDRDLNRLQAEGRILTIEGRAVVCLREESKSVVVELRCCDSRELHEARFDRVFLAAGAIQSTRIVLNSLQLFDQKVFLKDSQKFILPLLRLRRSPLAWPNAVALAGAFIEFKVPGVSDHWIHAQVSGVNDYVLQRFKLAGGQPSIRGALLAPLYERLLIAWCGLHSDQSSRIALTLTSRTRDGLPVLRLDPDVRPGVKQTVRRIAHHLARKLLRTRTLALTPAFMLGNPGGGNHYGGSLPMRARPLERLDADPLGRVGDWRRIHVVDGAILPSIPATTMALLQMANADRIAMAVAGEGRAL
jgi:choline dehydrogenase-like flavoprotein